MRSAEELQAREAHEQALEDHNRTWELMHRVGLDDGRDSCVYLELREETIRAVECVHAAYLVVLRMRSIHDRRKTRERSDKGRFLAEERFG